MSSPSLSQKKKHEMQCGIYSGFHLGDFKRERALLSKNTGDPTVGNLRDKKENCSTRRGLRVGTGFREFPQTLGFLPTWVLFPL